MNRRLQRVAELLKRELSEILRRELSIQEVGILSINEIKVSSDLRAANVYLGFVGTKDQKKRAPERLESSLPKIQLLLGSMIRLKFTPQLTFIFDDSLEKANRVLAILDDLEHQRPPAPPQPPSA